MSGAGGGSRLTPTEKEIARKLPLLDEEQQKRYDKFLILGIDAYGKISDQYRLGIVNTLLQPLPEREQDRQISGYLRDEYFRTHDNDQRAKLEAHKAQLKARAASHKPAPAPAREPEAPARANDNRFIRSQHEKEKPPGLREGLEPHGSDYSDLVRTHERVAEMQRKGTGQSAAVGAPQQPEAQRPRTKQEFLERQQRERADQLAQAAQRPAAPEARQQQGKAAQQQPNPESPHRPEARGKPKTMEEFLERERRDHAERFGKAAQRSAGREITQQAKGQGRGPSFGGGISG